MNLWWDNTETQIRVFCHEFTANITNVKNVTMASLEADIVHREGKLDRSNNAGSYQLLLEKKTQLRELIQQKAAWVVTQTEG